MSKKILIFQYSWLLQNYSIDLASKLIDLGFEVYFLGFNITKHQLSDLSQFKKRGIFFKEFIDSEKKITSTNKPSIKIQLLLRTLPEAIRRETLREDNNMKIIKDLANKYTMVQKLSQEIA